MLGADLGADSFAYTVIGLPRRREPARHQGNICVLQSLHLEENAGYSTGSEALSADYANKAISV